MNLTDLLPTAEDIALYLERGYYISPVIFSDDELDAAVEASERFYGGSLTPHPTRSQYAVLQKGGWIYDKAAAGWDTERDGDVLRKHDYADVYVPELEALARKPVLGAIAAQLAQAEVVRLWHTQLLYKPSGAPGEVANVGWHTDRSYWQSCTSERMLTAWIPFHDCGEDEGTLMFLEGSNRWHEHFGEGLGFWETDLSTAESRLAAEGRPVRPVPAVLQKGQVSFHSCLTLHGSRPNVSGRPRRSIAVHMQDGDNGFAGEMYEGRPSLHTNEGMCRRVDGKPDFTDPVVCPVLYPQ